MTIQYKNVCETCDRNKLKLGDFVGCQCEGYTMMVYVDKEDRIEYCPSVFDLQKRLEQRRS